MKPQNRLARPLLAGLTVVIAGLSLAQTSYAGGYTEPTVPAKIQVEDGHKIFSVQHAIGVQIYKCNAVNGGYSWGLLAPRANLYDSKGKLRMTHFGGPTWQARDGSQVRGARVDGVPAQGTIDWLLLRAASTAPGADGDQLTNTSFIQRLNTTGGVIPPAGECTAETVNTTKEIPYTADYYFWKPTGH